MGVSVRLGFDFVESVLSSLHFRFVRKAHHKANMGEVSKITVLKRVDNIIKSAGDNRSYRGLELNNHLKVLLVSDPTTDKSAAAMDVNIGKGDQLLVRFDYVQFYRILK